MDVRRRLPSLRRPLHEDYRHLNKSSGGIDPSASVPLKASDALPLPLYLTNAIFFTLFFSAAYYLLQRWREKIRTSTPLHVLTLSEIAGVISLIASFIYLLGFFGIDFVQSFTRGSQDSWDMGEEEVAGNSYLPGEDRSPCSPVNAHSPPDSPPAAVPNEEDDAIIESVVSGKTQLHSLEAELGDSKRAAAIRRGAVQKISGKSLAGLPLEGFDYDSILGQCCEMPVGYVQVPVGIAGPLLLNGKEYTVPMATTEGCLVASTNRGCKAIHMSGGATCVVLRDAMTRAPVVRLPTVTRASELKFFLEDPMNMDTLSIIFDRSSRFARLQSIKCALAGRNVYMRFSCSTGDAMGMNMVSKGVQKVLEFLQSDFRDMDVIGISGNYCSDKKAAAVNWIEGRGKSVVCEAVIKGEVVRRVLKTEVAALVELNVVKNLAGSAVAGSLGGFNAHASNIVAAIFIATGQDPAQTVESSSCMTMMEAVNGGRDVHVSVTMPSIEVGTVGGGTHLSSQSACLNLLGVKGASGESPGSHSRILATIVAASVLAGELSLMSAISKGHLVRSHMRYNRSSRDLTS